ncbi:MAG: SDR family oxidoreductase [Clostridia bacterium]|nr:SDR family oxidoreductase [Clostridia bacterium]
MLRGKKILVVGASRGIGEAIAYAYAKEGADLTLVGRNLETLQPVAEKCRAMGVCAYTIEWDVADVKQADAVMAKAAELMGDLHVVLHNAGVIDREKFLSVREEEWDRIFAVNVKGAYFCCQAAANFYLSAHENADFKGKIIVISSECGHQPHISPYGISKWSVHGLCNGLAKALFKRGVVLQNIAPGPVTTEMMHWEPGKSDAWGSAFGRMAHPEEIADLAVFLATDKSNRIAGMPIYINGGLNT